MSKQYKIILSILLFLANMVSFAQGASLSPYDLKESYLENRASFESSRTKKIAPKNQEVLDKIVVLLKDNAPDSYEYNLVKYINGNFDLSLKQHLFDAYKLKPDALEIRQEMFGYYALIGNKTKQKEFALKLKSNYSKNTYSYYKFIANNPQISTLFFSGEADAYPILILQILGEVRANITLVNLDFLQNNSYRKKIEKKLGMTAVNFIGSETEFIAKALAAQNGKAYISTTISQNYLSKISKKTFLTGLYYQYNSTNQQMQLEAFWEETKAKLNTITLKSNVEKRLYSNYLPPLLTLYKLKLGAKEKDIILRKGITLLAEKVGKVEMVNGILKTYEQGE